MSGEAKGYTFRRTSKTTRSTEELHKEFNKIFFTECPLREYVKMGHPVELIQHGDDHVWARDLVLKGMFEFSISLHEGWQEGWRYLEDEARENSFLSLAKKFAEDNDLQFFENYIFGTIYHKGESYNINPDDKNIDKIVELWLNDDRQAIVDIMEKKTQPQMITFDFRVDSIIAVDAEVGTNPDDLRQQVLSRLAHKARVDDIEVTLENTFNAETGEYDYAE